MWVTYYVVGWVLNASQITAAVGNSSKRCALSHVPYHFTERVQIAAPIMELCLTANPPAYDVVVDLDHRIRKFMHATTYTTLSSEDELSSPAAYFQRRSLQQSCSISFVQLLRL
jgi:hypothetical protein